MGPGLSRAAKTGMTAREPGAEGAGLRSASAAAQEGQAEEEGQEEEGDVAAGEAPDRQADA
ncbi:MAG: hypothetical protein JWM33_2327, partial [Caulobacteraceae bacterium]|nr:hypothetical protein [Caulobacteraceae bacterium]